MGDVIFRTDKQEWADAALAKKELKFFRSKNTKGQFNSAIEKEEAIIRSFMNRAA